MSAYRRQGAVPCPIEDGEYEDLGELTRAVVRAARHLGEPVVSADLLKSWRIGFAVGRYHWVMRPRLAAQTCPPELWAHLRCKEGRLRLAKMLTDRALGGNHPIQAPGR